MSEAEVQQTSRAAAAAARAEAAEDSRLAGLSPGRALLLPAAFGIALVLFALLTPVRRHPNLFPTFLGASAALGLWLAALYVTARRAGRSLTIQIGLYKHHWVQACAQMTVLLYWGWHVSFVYPFLPLILAQLIFAYGVDSLLHWSRRDTYRFGFGPFPVVLSINLFLWFRPDWFHWQFVMILLGYLGKELIRWNRGGRSRHIFNPSSLPLAIFSVVLILTGNTELTFGQEIAQSQYIPPYIYLVIFLASLPGQILFGVARMTMPAVVTMYVISEVYFRATGVFLFPDAHISLPVFLGMHLLFTDPSTSPRSESGQIAFGVMYALGTLAFYLLLTGIGAPPFYDKLLPVPLMNLTVRAIDRVAASNAFARFDPARIGRALTPLRRNVAYVSIWSGIFLALSATPGIGDDHPGQYLPFWQEACREGNADACDYAMFMKFNYCDRGSGWACNEWAIDAVRRGFPQEAGQGFRRGCELGFGPACENAERVRSGAETFARAAPTVRDLPIVLQGSKGRVLERDPSTLYAIACDQGWPGMCDGPPGASDR